MNTQTNTTLTALEKSEETLDQVEAAQGVDFENLLRSSLGEGASSTARNSRKALPPPRPFSVCPVFPYTYATSYAFKNRTTSV